MKQVACRTPTLRQSA